MLKLLSLSVRAAVEVLCTRTMNHLSSLDTVFIITYFLVVISPRNNLLAIRPQQHSLRIH
jgi:hypothetical protein